MRIELRLLAACIAAVSVPAAAGSGVWTTNGPAGGDAPFLVADPSAPGTLVAATRGGMFRSTDGGGSWARFENGLDFWFPYALDASDAGTIYTIAAANTLSRSNAGSDWLPTALALPADAALLDVSVRPGAGEVIAVSSTAGLRISVDGGASFATPAGTGLPPAREWVQIEHAAGARLYVASLADAPTYGIDLFRSDDGGNTWTASGALPDAIGYNAGDLQAAPSDANRVYLTTYSTVFTTANGGATWTPCAANGPRSGRLQIDPANPLRVWGSGPVGVMESVDGCASWTPRVGGLSADGSNTDATAQVALAPGFPGDPRVWVATPTGGVYRSSNAGVTFAPVNNGLVATNIRAIAMHPTDADEILLGYGDAPSPSPTLYRSSNAGFDWMRSNTGLAGSQIRGIAYDPTTAALPGGAHVYAVGRTRSDTQPAPGVTDAGIYKSVDGGASWSTIDNGIPADYIGGTRFIGTVRSVVLDARSCVAPPSSGPCVTGPLRTVYVTASGRVDYTTGVYAGARIYKSTDAGATWAARENGLPPPVTGGICNVSQIAVPMVVSPDDPQTLYVGLSLSYAGDPSCPVPVMPNGVFKSTDGGANWVHASTGLPRIGGAGTSQWSVLALAIDPLDPDTLYAGASTLPAMAANIGRVFKSTDAGATWTDISVGIAGADVRAILVDPNDTDTVYVGTGGSPASPSGVFRSTDGGLTWNSFSIGLPADAATALALDPHDSRRLLAGTPGGLWEFTQVPDGDSDGAITTVENAAPNAGDANTNGVPDAQEADVASFFGVADTSLARAAAGKGTPQPAITLDVTPLAGTCARINNAHALAGDHLPADIARGVAPAVFDRGVLRFELPDCERARVTVTFHGADDSDVDWVWRNYGPLQPGVAGSFDWYTFAGAKKVAPDTWELVIDADERGNYRAESGSILFVGAPGFVDIQVFGDGME